MDEVEYGVVLSDGLVAPAASLGAAVAYGLGRCRPICVRYGGEWRLIAPSAVAQLPVEVPAREPCRYPGHGTIRAHEAAGERTCPNCRAWDTAYRRTLRARRKSCAA